MPFRLLATMKCGQPKQRYAGTGRRAARRVAKIRLTMKSRHPAVYQVVTDRIPTVRIADGNDLAPDDEKVAEARESAIEDSQKEIDNALQDWNCIEFFGFWRTVRGFSLRAAGAAAAGRPVSASRLPNACAHAQRHA